MMERSRILGSFAGALLLLGTANADATTILGNKGYALADTSYAFGTSSLVPAAVGTTVYANATNSYGGLCQIAVGNTDGCVSSAGLGHTAGTLSTNSSISAAGIIQLLSPAAVANYSYNVTITQYSPSGKGDIYALIVDGSQLGTTSPTPYNTGGSSATFTFGVDGGNVPIYISVTDLFQQWLGTTNYLLPGEINSAYASYNNAAGISSNWDTASAFTFSYNVSAVPEPASLMLLGGALCPLGLIRRRRQAT